MPIKEEDLARFRTQGDEEADAALVDIWPKLSSKEQSDLLRILGQWDPTQDLGKLPAPIAEYVARPFDNPPAWIKAERIERAQAAYTERHGAGGQVVLATYSLPILYIHPKSP
jgi:hypothetical protein